MEKPHARVGKDIIHIKRRVGPLVAINSVNEKSNVDMLCISTSMHTQKFAGSGTNVDPSKVTASVVSQIWEQERYDVEKELGT